MTPRLPAPAFDCFACGRTIGKQRGHRLIDGDRVICLRCALGGQAMHRKLWPQCTQTWHDPFDHPGNSGTRAGIAARLGAWP